MILIKHREIEMISEGNKIFEVTIIYNDKTKFKAFMKKFFNKVYYE